MSKFVAILVLVALVLGSVTAVVAQATTDLSLWVFVDDHGVYMTNQAARWNEENPDRPISITYTFIDYNTLHDNLLAALLVGSGAPDLADIEISKFATFTKGDIHLLDLSAVVDPYRADIIETRLAPYQVSGAQYGIDYHLGAFLMYYNAEVMEAAGVDPDSIVTWDDYVAAGQQVTRDTDGDGSIDVYMTTVEVSGPFTARSLMLMNGGGAYNADGELILESPENVEALQFMQDLVHEYGIAVGAPGGNHHAADHFQAFAQGQFASLWMPQWYMIRYPNSMADLEGKMVVRPMPIFEEGGFTTTMGGGTGTAVTDQTPEEERQLAMEFLAFSKLTYEANIELWLDLGFDPMRPDVYEDERLLEPNPFWSGEIPFEILKSELGNVAPEYTGPQYPEIATILTTTALYDLIENQVPAEEVLANVVAELEAMASG
jgi:arabinosaccharide transport system substrate-binding protein